MSWFRQRGKYWYFVRKENGKERRYYLGSDERIIKMVDIYKSVIFKYPVRKKAKRTAQKEKESSKSREKDTDERTNRVLEKIRRISKKRTAQKKGG